MKKLILVLVVILIASFTLQGMASKAMNWAEIWGFCDEEDKMILLLGTMAGNVMDLILLSSKSAQSESLEVSKFVVIT